MIFTPGISLIASAISCTGRLSNSSLVITEILAGASLTSWAKPLALTEVSHKLAEAMYQKDQNAQGGATQQNKKDDDVIDAEVE